MELAAFLSAVEAAVIKRPNSKGELRCAEN